jgi:hypothetical protein
MRGSVPIPGELLSCFPGYFLFSGIGGRSFSCGICAEGWVNCGGERRAVVWPVSCLVRGRACPGGRTLVRRRPGRPCPALVCPAWPPGLARRGSRAREVGKEPHRAAPGTGPFAAVPGTAVGGVRPSRGHSHVSPLSHRLSGKPRVPGRTRNVTIVPQGAGAWQGRAGPVRRPSPLPALPVAVNREPGQGAARTGATPG